MTRKLQRAAWLLAVGLVGTMALAACGGDGGTKNKDDVTAPPAPANLRFTQIGDGAAALAWDAVQDDRDGAVVYTVYRAGASGQAAPIDTTSGTAYQDNGLDYETEYTYHVTAVDEAGNESAASEPTTGQPFNLQPPDRPANLRAIAHNLTAYTAQGLDVTLDWDASLAPDLAHYRVYRGSAAGFAADAGTLVAEPVSPLYVDRDVQVGTAGYYRVSAVDRGGKVSQLSLEVTDVPLPLAVLISPVQGASTVAVPAFQWAPVAGALTYQVVVTTSPTSGEISAIPRTAANTAAFVGRAVTKDSTATLVAGQLYYWKVIASSRADGQENSVTAAESFKVR